MSRIALALALLAAAALPAAADAQFVVRPGDMLEDHLHNTDGQDWHVQMQANKTGTRLTTVILYAEGCNETGIATKVPIAADRSFSVQRPLEDGKGTWSVQGRFPDPDHATGTWSVTRGTCAITDHPYSAHDGTGHFLRGNPGGYAPPAIRGGSANARKLRALQRLTRANAHRWDTRGKAARLGYVPFPGPQICPGLLHVRKHGVRMWGKLLDPTAPQSLVFWCDSQRNFTLVAAMYRAAPAANPPTFGNLIEWHKHGRKATWMTHIWMVSDPVSAFAACVPFPALEAAGMLHRENYLADIPIDEPCPDTSAGSGADATSPEAGGTAAPAG